MLTQQNTATMKIRYFLKATKLDT